MINLLMQQLIIRHFAKSRTQIDNELCFNNNEMYSLLGGSRLLR